MNLKRVAIAGIGAWIFAFVYGVMVSRLLGREISRYPGVFRSAHQMGANAAILLVGSLLSMLAAAYIYGKGYEGGSGIAQGARFGFVLALFVLGWASVGNYAILNIGGRLGLFSAAATFVEVVLLGCVIGALYKPSVPTHAVRV
jgi:hypothetical protein